MVAEAYMYKQQNVTDTKYCKDVSQVLYGVQWADCGNVCTLPAVIVRTLVHGSQLWSVTELTELNWTKLNFRSLLDDNNQFSQ